LSSLAVTLLLLGVSIWRDLRPFHPARPKLLPYSLISLLAGAIALVLAGHALGLLGLMPARPS
jgi:hypothetical protein